MSLLKQVYIRLKRLPNWRSLVPGSPEDASVSLERGNNKEILRIFPNGAKTPTLLLKYTRTEQNKLRIDREAYNLEWLKEHVPPTNMGTPVDFLRINLKDYEALIFPYCNGQPMTVSFANPMIRYSPRKWNNLLDLAADWLLKLQKNTSVPVKNVEEFIVEHRMLSSEDKVLIAALRNSTLPLAAQHGDFNPENILLNESHMHIVDWEWAVLPGLPLIDLFNMALRSSILRCHLGRQRSGLPNVEHARSAFVQDSVERQFVLRWLPSFQQELHISKELVIALLHCYLRHAINEEVDMNDIVLAIKKDI